VFSLSAQDKTYLSLDNPDLVRLKQTLCRAWHQDALGLTKFVMVSIDKQSKLVDTAERFAAVLSNCGIETSRYDVENAKRNKIFHTNACPPTKRCIDAVDKLRRFYPALNYDDIFAKTPMPVLLAAKAASESLFVSRASSALCSPDFSNTAMKFSA